MKNSRRTIDNRPFITCLLNRRSKITQTVHAFFLVVLTGLITAPAHASVVYTASGFSAKGVAVNFEAVLGITGDTLTVTLNNLSLATLNPDDLLASFYFDIVNGSGVRPALSYDSAIGDAWRAYKNAADVKEIDDADLTSNIVYQTSPTKTDTWLYKAMDVSSTPNLGFGIGTVGNNNLSPNGFDGSLVDTSNLGIYVGDITTQNLDGKLLIKDTATFTFSGLTGFTEADLASIATFGLGTAPDSLLVATVPVPAAVWLFGSGLLGLVGIARRKKA